MSITRLQSQSVLLEQNKITMLCTIDLQTCVSLSRVKNSIVWHYLVSCFVFEYLFNRCSSIRIIATVITFNKNWNFWTWTVWIHRKRAHAAHLLRDRSTSSFFQRSVGLGSPWTWHLNSRLSSTRTTWFTGRCTNTGLSESGQNILRWF